MDDNTTLNQMSKTLNEQIIPIFIFTPEQIKREKNPYFSNNLVQFMCNSLKNLNNEYKKKGGCLSLFEGDIIYVLKNIKTYYNIKSVGFNRDYSPYSIERDIKIMEWCKLENIKLFLKEDMLLVDIDSHKQLNSNYKPYKVFTPFMRYEKSKCSKPRSIDKYIPKISSFALIKSRYYIPINSIDKFYTKNKNALVREIKYASKILSVLNTQKEYAMKRNFLTYKTSQLSAYINLGIVSIRQVYYKIIEVLGIDSPIITELYWRDFYYNILFFYPHITQQSFRPEYDNIAWNDPGKEFELWKEGKTGFPIVDACMRQLNKTGYMHNRGRMIVASFLTKDLLINWREGERYFANKLIDYNISANNGGWQWAAGSGTDAQPYFRIFNPWTQMKDYDPDCNYVKEWIPELRDIPAKEIHKWYEYNLKYPNIKYPAPILDHNAAYKKALIVFKKGLNK
tara:strand:+ start:144 stop:1502 length:1359 start_codon:yes stop_codon:yes gene_type:complete